MAANVTLARRHPVVSGLQTLEGGDDACSCTVWRRFCRHCSEYIQRLGLDFLSCIFMRVATLLWQSTSRMRPVIESQGEFWSVAPNGCSALLHHRRRRRVRGEVRSINEVESLCVLYPGLHRGSTHQCPLLDVRMLEHFPDILQAQMRSCCI